jgi:hypothetical protein
LNIFSVLLLLVMLPLIDVASLPAALRRAVPPLCASASSLLAVDDALLRRRFA